MRDCRRFLSLASAKRQTVIVFGVVHALFLESCRREVRDSRRFCRDAAAILVTLVVFCLLNRKAL